MVRIVNVRLPARSQDPAIYQGRLERSI